MFGCQVTYSKQSLIEFSRDEKTQNKPNSNEHRLLSVARIEFNPLLIIKGHQKKAYIS